jgi:hypothetical protein
MDAPEDKIIRILEDEVNLYASRLRWDLSFYKKEPSPELRERLDQSKTALLSAVMRVGNLLKKVLK